MSRKLRLFVDQEQSDAVVAEFNRYDRIIPMSLSREMLYCWVMDTIVHAVNNVIAEVPWEWPALGDYIPESISDEIDMFCDNVAAGIHSHAPHEEYVAEYKGMLSGVRETIQGVTRSDAADEVYETIKSVCQDYNASSVKLLEINYVLSKLVLEFNND